jgi:hypothetical protein
MLLFFRKVIAFCTCDDISWTHVEHADRHHEHIQKRLLGIQTLSTLLITCPLVSIGYGINTIAEDSLSLCVTTL